MEFIRKLTGRINHIHLIDSDNTCHKDDNGEDETSAHPPFGLGLLELRRDHAGAAEGGSRSARLVDHRPLLLARRLGGTETCKKYVDGCAQSTEQRPTEMRMPKELRVGMIGYGFMGRPIRMRTSD